MEKLLELREIAKEEKKLQIKRDKLEKEQDELDSRIFKVAYKLYQVFIDKNWNSLNIYDTYYYLFLEFHSDDTLTMEKLKYIDTYSEKIADFSVVSAFKNNRRINLYPDVEEENYSSISVIIDQEQLSELEEKFVIRSRE